MRSEAAGYGFSTSVPKFTEIESYLPPIHVQAGLSEDDCHVIHKCSRRPNLGKPELVVR